MNASPRWKRRPEGSTSVYPETAGGDPQEDRGPCMLSMRILLIPVKNTG
jgi:hypothetical protein